MTRDEFVREVKEWVHSILVALVLTLILRTFVV